jgi:tungstate transport system substrate-binding protein
LTSDLGQHHNRLHLEILTEGDPALFNPYGSILVNPAKWPPVKFSDARAWHNALTSKSRADAIASYRIKGEQVFFPMGNGTTHEGDQDHSKAPAPN